MLGLSVLQIQQNSFGHPNSMTKLMSRKPIMTQLCQHCPTVIYMSRLDAIRSPVGVDKICPHEAP